MNDPVRDAFNVWWLGPYGPYSLRAEYPNTPVEAAQMAWQAQQERIDELERKLEAIEQGAKREKTA